MKIIGCENANELRFGNKAVTATVVLDTHSHVCPRRCLGLPTGNQSQVSFNDHSKSCLIRFYVSIAVYTDVYIEEFCQAIK
jgi:hypothetical protein